MKSTIELEGHLGHLHNHLFCLNIQSKVQINIHIQNIDKVYLKHNCQHEITRTSQVSPNDDKRNGKVGGC